MSHLHQMYPNIKIKDGTNSLHVSHLFVFLFPPNPFSKLGNVKLSLHVQVQ